MPVVESAMKRGFFPEAGSGRAGRTERMFLAAVVQTVFSEDRE